MRPTRVASAERDDSLAHKHEHDLALLSPADIDFISGFRNTAASEIAKGRGLGGLLEAVSRHLDRFEQEVRRAGTLDGDQASPTPPLSDPWGPVTAERDVLDANTVGISGPGPHDRFQVVLSSPGEAVKTVKYVAGVDAACRRLEDMRGRCVQLVQKRLEVGQELKHLRQPAETTVNDHIRLLRQYNKMKDVGQQLIGLIAENRGVPVGSLYADQDYGVGPDD